MFAGAQVFGGSSPGIVISLIVLVPAILLRLWRSWPYVSIDSKSATPRVEVRDFREVRRVLIDSSSTLRLSSERKAGDRHYFFKFETPTSRVSSRAYVGGKAGIHEVLALAQEWEAAGGQVAMDSLLMAAKAKLQP